MIGKKKKKTGLYWDKNSFSLIQAQKGTLLKSVCVPFSDVIAAGGSATIPDDLKLSAILQKIFLDNQIDDREVILSLPSKDLILRSFIIPDMAPHEIKSVIEFEITKYVPIKLEELAYTFHAIPFESNKLKNLRIIFVAIRKKTLAKYREILKNADITIAHVEPAAVSVLRLLKKFKHIPPNHTTAVVQIEDKSIAIVMAEQDVVQFIRESSFTFDISDYEQFISRLTTDLRVSMNFFTRINTNSQVKRIVLLSSQPLTRTQEVLEDEFKIPVYEIFAATLLHSEESPDIGLLNAYGAALKPPALVSKDFNLGGEEAGETGAGGGTFGLDAARIAVPAVTAVLAGLVIFATIVFSNNLAVNQSRKLETLKAELGPFASMQTEDIQKMIDDVKAKATDYSEVRTTSNTQFYLSKISSLMPEGMWLRSFKITYQPVKASMINLDASGQSPDRENIELRGYVYRDSDNDQFKVINNFYALLKQQPEFNDRFSGSDLKIRQEVLRNYRVSSFVITSNQL